MLLLEENSCMYDIGLLVMVLVWLKMSPYVSC